MQLVDTYRNNWKMKQKRMIHHCLVENSTALHPVPKTLSLKIILDDVDFENLS